MSDDKITLDVQGLDGVLDTLEELPKELTRGAKSPVSTALKLAARKFRKLAKTNLQAAIDIRGSDSTGTTLKNVIIKRMKPEGGAERYIVTVRDKAFYNAKMLKRRAEIEPAVSAAGTYKQKARIMRKAKIRATSTQMTARLLEWGSVHQPATPWLRKTGTDIAPSLISETADELADSVEKLAAQIAREKGVPK